MLGKHNRVAAHVLKENSRIFIQGCPCHLLHIAAKKASTNLHSRIEELLIDIFHYLENSSKRMKALQQFQLETGSAVRKIIKHGPARWLSLHQCIKRLIEQWDALNAFFCLEKDTQGDKATERLKRIIYFFNDKASKAYCFFLDFSLPMFINANLMLQREEPTIYLLQRRLHEVATDLLVAFIKPEVITKSADIYKVEHSRRSKQKDREDIMLGEATRSYLALKQMSGTQTTHFFEDVRKFFSVALGYIFSNLPLQEEALAHAEVLDINLRSKVKFSSIRYWKERFPCLLDGTMEKLEREFSRYQVESFDRLDLSKCVDLLWHQISLLKDDNLKEPRFTTLAKFMKGLCVIPHSNADSERIFSVMRKNKTEMRASMSRQLLSDILHLKAKMITRSEVCHSLQPSDSLIKRVKYKHQN